MIKALEKRIKQVAEKKDINRLIRDYQDRRNQQREHYKPDYLQNLENLDINLKIKENEQKRKIIKEN